MYKLSHQVEDRYIEHSHSPVMQREKVSGGSERLIAGVPAGDSDVFSALIACLEEPFFVLYVLHTPRGEGDPGRYQSPGLSRDQLVDFLAKYSNFLSQDARHDIWVRSQSSNGTLVWDRHNIVYAYGPISEYESALFRLGFSNGEVIVPFPHCHHYREEFDSDAQDIIASLEWTYTELRPEDEQ